MKLTQHSDYALRVLMLLAIEPDAIHTIASVADRYEVSRNHLMKVAQTLIQAGFVEGLRGRHGGLRLAREPADITLGAVVRATEDNFALVECFDRERNVCVVTQACGLRRPLENALRAFLTSLDTCTLADVVGPPNRTNRMRNLLAVG